MGNADAEGASRRPRRINLGRQVKMEAAGKAGVCLAVGVRTPGAAWRCLPARQDWVCRRKGFNFMSL